ncbi:MAG TPA: type I DNA topoisomerase, partial [Candidatus Saccharimonadales bacterium]|nr:type I DNA topoisomerase [Candidatus Saccharimonadales bacterium]
MKLVIVESPTKAKTLSGILGKDYVIKASMGHIRDLPQSGKSAKNGKNKVKRSGKLTVAEKAEREKARLGIDIAHDFAPIYEVPEKSQKVLADLTKASKSADGIILATDPDREGEAIAWHLSELLKGTFERVVFHELTKGAIEEAFKHPGKLDLNLVNAQQARRILDRLVGYKLSPLLWKNVMFGLSAGRVQSVAVRIIVERERERQAFKPEEYWSIQGNFVGSKDKKVTAELVEHKDKKLEIKNKEQTSKIEAELNKAAFSVAEVKKSERQRKAYPPFKTSTLQQSASNVFGYTAKRTMMAAQKLFENGFITYHRTDSITLSEQFITTARDFIKKEMGAKYLPDQPEIYKTKAKNAQEAHEGIRPTNLEVEPSQLTSKKLGDEELKVYSLIWKRSIESQMLPAVYDQTTLNIKSGNDYLFRANGSVIKFEGWMYVGKHMGIEEDPESLNELPEFAEGEKLDLSNLLSDQHFTQPPARYSDATLIKALEELEIGRPSTYAPTISTIQSRGYVTKEGRYFVPTDVAYVVNDLLVENFPEIVDYKFTADLENDLDNIADGKKEWVPFIRAFYEPFEKELVEKEKTLNKHDVTNLGEIGEKCPECGRPLIYKLGIYGKFISCTGYPECKYARPLDAQMDADGNEVKQDYGKCPDCETGVLILKQGPYG